jgi:mRNA interferase MazF
VETGLAQVVLSLITSNLKRTGATRVVVSRASPAGRQMRLFVDSVVVCDVIQTTEADAIVGVIGVCPIMPEIDKALRFLLDL